MQVKIERSIDWIIILTAKNRKLFPCLMTLILSLLMQITIVVVEAESANLVHKAANSGAPDYKYGSAWGSDYSCGTCHQKSSAANIKKIKNYIITPLGNRKVVLNRMTTASNNSTGIFGNDERVVNQNNSSNICEVCHHRTMYHQYSSSKISNKSHSEHKSNKGDCTQCHQHGRAFARPNAKDCGSCHGSPPVTNSDYGGAAQGLSAPATLLLGGTAATPPVNIGAHDRHRNKNGFECSVCHNGDINIYHGYEGNDYVEIGFRIDKTTWPPFTGSVITGTFSGYSSNSTRAKYAVAPGNPGTLLRGEAVLAKANTCAIYCHGDNWNIPSGRVGQVVSWTQGPLGNCENSACHGSSVQNPPTPVFSGVSTGGHKTHVSKLGNDKERCAFCHDNYYSSNIHMINGHVKVNLSAYSPIASYKGFNQMSTGYLATTGSYGSCTNLYCHSAVQTDGGKAEGSGYKTVSWGGGYLLCGECHGGRATDAVKITSGNHAKHISSYSYGCSDCHQNAGKDNPLKHGDKNIDIAFSTTYGGSYSQSVNPAGKGYGSCSANYCHSEGTVFNGPYTQLGYVNWTSGFTSLPCNSCHTGGAAGSKIGPSYSGTKANSHNTHQFTCDNCHASMVNASGTITNRSLHVNKSYNILAGGTSSFGAVAGDPATPTTCSNISCHFNKPATWGGTLDCNGCHGSDAVTLTSKKHSAHISTSANATLGNAIGCYECHAKSVNADNVSVKSGTIHINGIFGDYSGQKAGRYTAASGTCDNSYCHSDGKGKYAGFNSSNGWNSSVVYTGCKSCHGSDAGFNHYTSYAGEPNYENEGKNLPRSNSHNSHVKVDKAASCDACHTNSVTTAGTGIKGGAPHLSNPLNPVSFNPVKSGASATYDPASHTCSNISCHGSTQPVWGDASGGCNSCHGSDAVTLTTYAHSGHISPSANASLGTAIGCYECHAKTVDLNRVVISQAIHVNGVYGDYSGPRGGRSYTSPTGICSNVYCHSDGKGRYTTFNSGNGWKSGKVYTSCKACHGVDTTLGHYTSYFGEPNYQNAGANQARSNSHQKHISKASDCNLCHSVTTITGTTIITDSLTHIDGTRTVTPGGTAGFTWTENTKTCSSVNCHFGKNIQWGANTLDCNGCHGSDAATLTSKKHTAHINTSANASLGNAIGCVDCHAKTVNDDNVSIKSGTIHINNVMGDYSGQKAGRYTIATGVCDNSYCHSDGKGKYTTFNSTNGWNSSVVYSGCKSCHGSDIGFNHYTSYAGEPNYESEGAGLYRSNSHQSHTTKLALKYSASCDYCHTDTVTAAGTGIKPGAPHLSAPTNPVSFNTVKSGSGAYDSQNRTCSNTSCHIGAIPKWGDAGSAGCKACHGNLSTVHAKHINDLLDMSVVTFYAYTANKSDEFNGKYRIGCANCHPTIESGNHRNGTVEVSISRNKEGRSFLNGLNGATTDGITATSSTSGIIGTSGTSVSCELAYCHSNGRSSTPDFKPSPNWYAAFTGNRCGMCHDNPPQYAGQSHYVAQSNQGKNGKRSPTEAGHMIGVHFANTYIGNNGNRFIGFTSLGNSAHGNQLLSSTISCYICHSGIVSSSRIDTHAMAGKSSVFNCSNCHSANSKTPLQAGLIMDAKRHINGVKDISFPSIEIKSKAQLANPTVATGWNRFGAYKSTGSYDYMNLGNSSWNSVDKTCATACHFNITVQWGTTQLECTSCHFDD